MKISRIEKPEILSARAESFLRIQRRDIYLQIYHRKDYRESKASESTLFRKRLPLPREQKKTAEAQKIIATHLEATNKGYDPDFIDYDTYDKRRNINYEKGKSKFDLKKKI